MKTMTCENLDLSTILPSLRRCSGSGELCGPCPRCGGKDRLHVLPDRERWFCRQCSPIWKPLGDLLRLMGHTGPLPSIPAPSPATPREPSKEWQRQAAEVVSQAEALLWTPAGEKARTWLHCRGLEEETLRAWRLGYSPGGEVAGLFVPRGVLLPWVLNGEPWALRVRCPVTSAQQEAGRPKYLFVKGSVPSSIPFGLSHLQKKAVLALCEGEFDTILLYQVAGDSVDILTLGSASARLPSRVLPDLIGYRRILLLYDTDKAGQEAARKLGALSKRTEACRVPTGKDITEALLQMGSAKLRSWLLSLIETLCQTLPEVFPKTSRNIHEIEEDLLQKALTCFPGSIIEERRR